VTQYIARRLLLLPIILIGLSLVTFTVSSQVPGNPLIAQLGVRGASNPVIVKAYKHKWGLDKSLPQQYLAYVENTARGDLGRSLVSQRPVADDLKQYLPATIELSIGALLFAAIPGILLGVAGATRPHSWIDALARTVALLGSSVPVFWLALLMLYVLYGRLGWLPGPGRISSYAAPPHHVTGLYTVDSLLAGNVSAFWDSAKHLILPCVVLGWSVMGIITRMIRSSLLEVMDMDFIRTARAKGLTGRTVLWRHAMRNALIPTITVLSLAMGGLLAGAVPTETVFSWPGIGQYAVLSAANLDLPGVMGVTLLTGVLYVGVNLFADVMYAIIDPRIRYS